MHFPFFELPQPQTPPSPTTYRSDPLLSNQNLSNLEHQFLYYPPEVSADSLSFDTSKASTGDISVNTPAEITQAPPVILSTPPTGRPQDSFGLGPAFEEQYNTIEGSSQLCFPPKQESQDKSLPDHSTAHRATFDASPFVSSAECSPAPSSFTLGTPLLTTSMPLHPTSRPGSAASVNATIPNIRKRSPSHIRISSLSLRASSPLSQTDASQAQPAAVRQGALRKPCSDEESKWYQEYIRVSKELQALQKQFAGIQEESCDLKVENRTLKSDLAWALGLNHYLPKIQNYVRGAQIAVGGNGGQPYVTENTTNTTSYAPITLPPMPAPMPAQAPYIYDNLSVAKTAFPHVSPKTASANQAQKTVKDYKLPVVHTQYHPHPTASATTTATWSTSYASVPPASQNPEYRQMALSPASGQKRSRMEID